jgi:hypothetical protein
MYGVCQKVAISSAVFLKLWSAAVRQVVQGDLQAVLEDKALKKLYQTLNE